MMSNKNRPIFITGRFRSGTSFLWQLFNELDGFCAWYEPLHPQLIEAIKHVAAKHDHVGVSDYWQTYRKNPRFSKYYTNRFATEHLYAEPQERHPELKTYINHLIELSQPETPVLQFNRVDFRLPWLKYQFPEAVIVHIERNPIQLYESQRKHIPEQFKHQADYWDAYELAQWSYALSDQIPLLTADQSYDHAFYRFYMLYKLSNIMARTQADISINLDVDVFQSEDFIKKLSQVVSLNKNQKQAIQQRVHVPSLSDFDEKGASHLIEIMTQVDLLLADSGLLENFGHKSMASVRFLFRNFWKQYESQPSAIEQLKSMAKSMFAELERVHRENQKMTKVLVQVDPNIIDDIETTELDSMINTFQASEQMHAMLKNMSDFNGLMTRALAVNQQLRTACQNAGINDE